MAQAQSDGLANGDRRWGVFALLYVALIVYGSLYPFSGWRPAPGPLLDFLVPRRGSLVSLSDVLTNVLAYMPLGLIFARRPDRRMSHLAAIIGATLAGTSLSVAMEFLQQFLPSRVASPVDLTANSLGTFAGALLARFMDAGAPTRATLVRWRDHWFLPGTLADLGLVAIGLWALSQAMPLVPSLDIGNLRHGLSPVWHTLQDIHRFNRGQCATYAFSIAGLALLATTLAQPGRSIIGPYFAFVVAVLAYKVPVVTRQLSLEAVAGAIAAVALALPLVAMRSKARAAFGAAYVAVAFVVYETGAEPGGILHSFNWLPFVGQMEHPLIGIGSILESVWPAAALAYAARFVAPSRPGSLIVAWIGGFALAGAAFALEWHQQTLPGRFGDVTTALLMVATWTAVWSTPIASGKLVANTPAALPRRNRWRLAAVAAVLALLAAAGLAAMALTQHPREMRVDESRLPKLPPASEAPAARLPGFKFRHPRLPNPSTVDLATLSALNPQFLRDVRARANGGRGDLEAATLQSLIEPGSVDLALLHRRLVELKFTWRGHDQGKPLAIAYDWLFFQWNDEQRRRLLDKLIDGCDYLVERIRQERLSPYNVILYNAPLQALMACSLAAYGDDPRAAPIMNFTADLWKLRVLPAWRQIMGRHGGWHEGGEYVGIGIGQAVHQLPAMWRSATGEDLFSTEPGIRGFLDFLVYRTQPDGTHFRWGDGAFFDKIVPDAIPLALEYRHPAAYGLRPPRGSPVPTGWPWGPLSDPSLDDPTALARLPAVRYFDGIGLLVARTDWSPGATYVTFRAGDNYWSHTHLDQGSFTIYKGGPLAIDSGLYGPVYGSDHHLNYTFQTIAHNTITVTDPEDTVPAPGKSDPRPIANDGGQRRVGSGWGVDAAPLDRGEWEQKRDIYHTATMEGILDQDGLAVGVADVTPAYTNTLSGHGTFSHRTRRVERFWRVLGYDMVDDVVVVFDRVTATRAAFRKRWLLHSVGPPALSAAGFSVTAPPLERTGRGGGRLDATVLMPKAAQIHAIGGPGFEFFVDTRNYDERGTLQEVIAKLGPNNGEPGAWRVEVSPGDDAIEDAFLVVLLPVNGDVQPTHQIRLLESGTRVGCEIVGPKRTTRWWFEAARNGTEVEIIGDGERRVHAVYGSAEAAGIADPGWPRWLRGWLGSR